MWKAWTVSTRIVLELQHITRWRQPSIVSCCNHNDAGDSSFIVFVRSSDVDRGAITALSGASSLSSCYQGSKSHGEHLPLACDGIWANIVRGIEYTLVDSQVRRSCVNCGWEDSANVNLMLHFWTLARTATLCSGQSQCSWLLEERIADVVTHSKHCQK